MPKCLVVEVSGNCTDLGPDGGCVIFSSVWCLQREMEIRNVCTPLLPIVDNLSLHTGLVTSYSRHQHWLPRYHRRRAVESRGDSGVIVSANAQQVKVTQCHLVERARPPAATALSVTMFDGTTASSRRGRRGL